MPRLYDPEEDLAIGTRIKRARVARNMSRSALAGALEISEMQLQKYEEGRNRLSVTAMKRIAAVLDMSPCDICGCCDD